MATFEERYSRYCNWDPENQPEIHPHPLPDGTEELPGVGFRDTKTGIEYWYDGTIIDQQQAKQHVK